MKVYLDHSATTPVDKRVMEAMLPYFSEEFGNANSIHCYGRQGAFAVDESRRKIAKLIGAKPTEIFFTSGGTESDNWALKGIARLKKNSHIITSNIEHPAILSSCKQLESEGISVTYLPVNSDGFIVPEQLNDAITENTVLISIMTANNETGTIMPINELVKIAHSKNILFHTDAVQAVGTLPIDVSDSGVDMMSFSAHKFYGPKGIGVLYVKNGVKIEGLINGGHQERSLRGGTTNVPLIVGMAKALEIAVAEREENNAHIQNIRDYFVTEVEKRIENVHLNGDRVKRLPQNANFTFQNITGEQLLLALDIVGIACSAGSACSSGSLDPSHVLMALGLSEKDAQSSIRFSFGKNNTKEEIEYVLKELEINIKKLRDISTLFAQKKSKIHKV